MVPSDLDLTIARLRQLLEKSGEAVPGLWKVLDETRTRFSQQWPVRCFAPLELVRGLLVGAAENSGWHNLKHFLTDLVTTALFAAWRTTQGVYVFDPDVPGHI